MLYEKFYKLMEEKPEWWSLATFIPNKRIPVYNWFYYKEGFARDLVLKLLEHFNIKQNQTVLDPFCGSGTTLLACKQRGINAIGFDVLPAALFAARVKTADYDIEELKQEAKQLLKKKFSRPAVNVPSMIRQAFSKYALEDITFFKYNINELKNRDFFLLALTKAALSVSYARKDGSVIKFRKKHVAPLSVMLRRTVYRMIKDVQNFSSENCIIAAEKGDARRLPLDAASVDAVITSPPYLNQIDYQKVYEIENFILLNDEAMPPLRSFISDSEYFKDMELVLKELYRVCRSEAPLALVIGNGFVSNEIIESDIILSDIAEQIGFKINKIIIMNKRFILENRTKKKGMSRESLILMAKN